jgi:hypothetical protein
MRKTVPERNLSELFSDDPRIKYARSKQLVQIAEEDPRRLAAHLDFFLALLKSDNNILKWAAIDVIGGLAGIESDTRAEEFLSWMFGYLKSGKLITANHAISALAGIAKAKPHFRKRIIRELLKTERYEYETTECHNIIMGKVVEALATLSANREHDMSAVRFVERQIMNSRPATRKKAQRFLKDIARPKTKSTTQTV